MYKLLVITATMKSATSFAIKANIASWIFFLLIMVVITFLLGENTVVLMANKLFAGILSVAAIFVSLYVAARTLLKNSKLTGKNKAAALQSTWYTFIIITLVFLVFGFKDTVTQFGFLYQLIALVAQIAAAYLAVWLLMDKPSAK
ncbi:hypothetical protein HN358_01440 [Candidatus Uhrbacteria bacterium]|jgi:hypothetical protein|nr:hypothetical protein [Candidatus Uhrbacteria bacterium]MBT7717307.1 hypothetical protein [Candidatus Uhrbacteria bacterium]